MASEMRDALPIIVGGCHRSGTSLVRRILNAHPHIYCGPETNFWRDFYSEYIDDPIRHGRFMTAARALLPEDLLLETLGGAFINLHERAAERAGKSRWADKDPLNIMHLSAWDRLLGEEWLCIHVIRNPLDTLASIKDVGFPFAIPGSLEDRITYYQNFTLAGMRFGAAHPSRYLQLAYEELVTDPTSTVAAMMNWLDECYDTEQLNFNRHVHQVGLEDPKIAATTKIHSESLGRWQGVLTSDEADQIVESCWVLWRQAVPESHIEVATP
jgi:Sulfotransferase family